jgi:hypothetical protein
MIWHLVFGVSGEPSLKATSLALAYHIASNRTAFRQLKYPCSGNYWPQLVPIVYLPGPSVAWLS